MKKSKRFELLAELAKNKEQSAAIVLGNSNQNYSEHVKKLEALQQFRLEYIEKFNLQGRAGMDVNAMQTYKQFIEGIEQAIRDQKFHIIESEQQCAQSKKAWQHEHSKTEIMKTTVNHYKKKETVEENHREQKETDDRPYRKNISSDT